MDTLNSTVTLQEVETEWKHQKLPWLRLGVSHAVNEMILYFSFAEVQVLYTEMLLLT